MPLGGYVLADDPSGVRPDVIPIVAGSEMHLVVEWRDRLMTEGVQARVVSMPSTDIFSTRSDRYRDQVVPPGSPLPAIEHLLRQVKEKS